LELIEEELDELYYLKKEKLGDFFRSLSKSHELYAPFRADGRKIPCDFNFVLPIEDYLFKRWLPEDKKNDVDFNEYRSVEPLRSFFTSPKENLRPEATDRKIAIFGAKNCDLFSLKIQDFVFLEGEFSDPLYEARRKNTLILSGDCMSFKEGCFCLALDITPFPTEGFDINFSLLDDGFLVELGNEKAMELIEDSNFFVSATSAQISMREQKRNAVSERIKEHLSFHKIPAKELLQEIVKNGYDSSVWQEEAIRCVECGGCNLSCDTCHCFLLSEDRFGNANEKVRLWDACLYANFARVAGGANPLKYRFQRLRNRYLKKFDFFPDNLKLNACCGCGRCIDVCPAKIDIRKILRRLNELR